MSSSCFLVLVLLVVGAAAAPATRLPAAAAELEKIALGVEEEELVYDTWRHICARRARPRGFAPPSRASATRCSGVAGPWTCSWLATGAASTTALAYKTRHIPTEARRRALEYVRRVLDGEVDKDARDRAARGLRSWAVDDKAARAARRSRRLSVP